MSYMLVLERGGRRYLFLRTYVPVIKETVWERECPLDDIEYSFVITGGPPEPTELGRLRDGSHIDGFLRALEILGLAVEEANCAQIVELFDFMQPHKRVLKGFDDLRYRRPGDILDQQHALVESGVRLRYTDERVIFIDPEKEDVAERYRDVIHPPRFSEEGGVRRITCWMADLAERDLERWEIIEEANGERRVRGELVEEDFVFSITVKVKDE